MAAWRHDALGVNCYIFLVRAIELFKVMRAQALVQLSEPQGGVPNGSASLPFCEASARRPAGATLSEQKQDARIFQVMRANVRSKHAVTRGRPAFSPFVCGGSFKCSKSHKRVAPENKIVKFFKIAINRLEEKLIEK